MIPSMRIAVSSPLTIRLRLGTTLSLFPRSFAASLVSSWNTSPIPPRLCECLRTICPRMLSISRSTSSNNLPSLSIARVCISIFSSTSCITPEAARRSRCSMFFRAGDSQMLLEMKSSISMMPLFRRFSSPKGMDRFPSYAIFAETGKTGGIMPIRFRARSRR